MNERRPFRALPAALVAMFAAGVSPVRKPQSAPNYGPQARRGKRSHGRGGSASIDAWRNRLKLKSPLPHHAKRGLTTNRTGGIAGVCVARPRHASST